MTSRRQVGGVARLGSLEPDATRTLLLLSTVLAALAGAAVSW
jgi:hypothetical protein